MRHIHQSAVLFVLILLGVAGNCLSGNETDPNDNRGGQGIIGPWHADSVALTPDNGAKRTLPKNDQEPFNITISDKTITMRVGERQFAELPYVLDAAQSPAAIDVKFQDEDMQGVYELNDDVLKISLNDAKKGRPKNFGDAGNGMDLMLRRFQGQPLMIINADGTNLRRLTSLPEYACGTSDWSPDGSKIAFDCWHSFIGADYVQSHIYVANSDGSSPKELSDGTLPSWSPDGKQISYSRYEPRGIWIMNDDGSNKHLIDPGGWSADWSPKNDELAYEVGGNICVLELKTHKSRYLLEKGYANIFWGLVWSPDGQWICFKGTLPDGGSELAIVNAQGQAKGFKVLLPDKAVPGMKSFETCFSWSPDNKRIALSMTMEGDTNRQIYILDIDGKTPPQRLAEQNPNKKSYTPAWSPDGKTIVFGIQK